MFQTYIGVISELNGLLLLQMYQTTFAALLVSHFMKMDGLKIEMENTHTYSILTHKVLFDKGRVSSELQL